MLVPRRGDGRADAGFIVATDDGARISDEVVLLVERAAGVTWYDEIGNDADLASLALCRLRRYRAGVGGGPTHGDAAVRSALEEVSPAALAWITSRAISYMDENGFPEALEPFVEPEPEPH